MSDFPFEAVVRKAAELMDQGFEVHQKFTCAGCGNRLTMAQKNTFFEQGTCDHCDVMTDIRRRGCNYMIIVANRSKDVVTSDA